MKTLLRLFFSLLALCLTSSCSDTGYNEIQTIQELHLGMSLKEVRAVYPRVEVTESGPFEENQQRVYQVAHISELGSRGEYARLNFHKDQLYGAYLYGFDANAVLREILTEDELERFLNGEKIKKNEFIFF
jgi:hypothetical protein